MTARDRLDLARLRREPAHVLRRLEHAVACEEARHVADRPPVWPWLLFALAAGIVAGATLIPQAPEIAQVVDAGGEE